MKALSVRQPWAWAIVSGLKTQGLAETYWDREDLCAQLDRLRHRDALDRILHFLDAETFEVDWKKEEILTDTTANLDKCIPSPNGWKMFTVDKIQQGPGQLPPAVDPALPSGGALAQREGTWTKWGVIFGGLALLATVILGILQMR